MKKTIFEEMGGTYIRHGDYLIPALTLPKEEEQRVVGVMGTAAFHRSRQRERRHCDGSQQYYDRGDVFGYFCD